MAARARRYGPLPMRELPPPPPLPAPPGLGAAVGGLLDAWWKEAGTPDPFPVVVEGPHVDVVPAILDGATAARRALRLVVVVPAPADRGRLAAQVTLEPAQLVLGELVPGESADDEPVVVPGRGPLVTAIPDPPALGVRMVHLALLSLSALPADRWVWEDGRWWEVRVAAADGDGPELRQIRVPGSPPPCVAPLAGEAERLVVPVSGAGAAWVADTRAETRGVVAVVDLLRSSSAEMAGTVPARGIPLDQIDPGGTGRRRTGASAIGLPPPLGVVEWRQ